MKPIDLIHLLPEIILLLAATIVFGLDLLGRRPSDSVTLERQPKPWLPYVALLGLGLAALGLIPNLAPANTGVVVATVLALDPFAIFFKALAIIGAAIVILAAIPFMRGRTPYRGEFYALLLVAVLAICLATGATNLIMLYLALEFLSITSYILAGFFREDRRSGEAALKYFLYGATASAVMLYGMSLLYGATGTTDLAGIARALGQRGSDGVWLAVPAIILLLAGFGFKASLVPFHQWAPDTYEGAPTPITAFLSTASKATGFAVLIRVFVIALGAFQPQWSALLAAVAVLTMTLGNLTALRQTNVKRMLAYSSIAQAGYILIGVVAVSSMAGAGASPFTGINGVLIYLFGYLATNLGAFAVVIAVENRSGAVEIKDYAGLIRRVPWLAAMLFIFLLSLTGIPPTAGFIGKLFVFGAAVKAQMLPLAVIAALNSVIAAFYYLNIVRYMFFTPAASDAEPIEIGRSLQGAVLLAGLFTLLIGLLPGPLIAWASQSVRMLALR